MADELPLGIEAARLLAFARGSDGPVLHLTAGEARAEEIARFVAVVAAGTAGAAFPPWDCLPYDWASPSAEAMGRRMALLRRLGETDAPRVVVTTPAAAFQRVPPREAVRAFAVRRGEPLDAEALRRFARAAGYEVDERVDEPGEVAFRGGGIDVFPGAERLPVRLEVSDGVVEAIRRYDPATQRSIEELDELTLDAASELPGREEAPEAAEDAEERERGAEHWLPDAYPALATLLDHMPGARLSATADALAARDAWLEQVAEAHRERARHQAESGDARRALPPERLYITVEEWDRLAAERRLAVLDDGDWEPVPAIAEDARPRAALGAFLREQAERGRRVLLLSATTRDRDRVARRARDAGAGEPAAVDGWDAALAAPPGAVLAMAAPLDHGFVDAEAGLAALAARDVLGSRAVAAEGVEATADTLWAIEAAELHLGDVVVHMDHGVARLDGLEGVGGVAGGEAVRLAYAGEQALLVPAAEAGRVWRYGSAEGEVALDKLHTNGWEKRRAKVAAALAETARALIRAVEERRAAVAPRLVPECAPYERLVARFPFEETADQAHAIRAVLADLAGGHPMNRLVIGDVGFGKTEVAIRAAAACAFAGKQVAVVAPTTVLARQHFGNFRRRFGGLVEVAHLSRLVGTTEARRVKEGLADGSVRVVVGTHAILGRGVEFADLGLVVIDEEQRLGQEDKRRARALAQVGHVLAMTATPIPRTLQSALVGLQDLSVIATAPARRRPIRTVITTRDGATLRQALLHERRRGGQSFVVVPRVDDVEPTAAELRALLPRLKLRVAHGKLPAKEIDEAMVGFAEGDGDVLLATSIIESGLDVPRANTMIVLRPDLFGLAQLHQLRGRVGRGHAQAFCTLMTEPGEELSPATTKRLGTLQAFDRLGAGLAISAQDLDQRGAGDLFGERQSGHVSLIGLPLYQELLAEAIRAARGEPARSREVEVQSESVGSLPPDYIPEPELRINLYHRLARTQDAGDVEGLAAEVADRFGPPPPSVEDLFAAASIRALARSLGVTRISAGPEAVALAFDPGVPAPERHADVPARMDGLEWLDGRLVLRRPTADPEARARLVLGLLEELA